MSIDFFFLNYSSVNS